MRTSRTESVFGYLMLFALALGILVPFLSLVLAAFNPPGMALTGMTWPSRFSWGNFALAWREGHFSTLTLASAKVELIVVPLTLILASLAGYALGAMRTPWSRLWSLLFLLGMTLPIEVVIVPLYFDLRTFGWTDSLVTVGLVESGAFLPFGVYWMRTHFATVPKEIFEAAEMDGA
ncbi:MAG: carbohydrate ABC transporter permease, partial [Propionibacteriaceae bacterium]|nr:carbohydrate ABC transporter permease [Propionibacteriaceae bacterium]